MPSSRTFDIHDIVYDDGSVSLASHRSVLLGMPPGAQCANCVLAITLDLLPDADI